MPENEEVILIVDKYINFMFNHIAGGAAVFSMPDIQSILALAEHESLEEEIIQKIIIYVSAAAAESNRKRDPVRSIKGKRYGK